MYLQQLPRIGAGGRHQLGPRLAAAYAAYARRFAHPAACGHLPVQRGAAPPGWWDVTVADVDTPPELASAASCTAGVSALVAEVLAAAGPAAPIDGELRARSHCRFVPPPIHFIPSSLT